MNVSSYIMYFITFSVTIETEFQTALISIVSQVVYSSVLNASKVFPSGKVSAIKNLQNFLFVENRAFKYLFSQISIFE